MRELPSCPSTTNTKGCCIIGKLGLCWVYLLEILCCDLGAWSSTLSYNGYWVKGMMLNIVNEICLAHFWACLFAPFLYHVWLCGKLCIAILHILQNVSFFLGNVLLSHVNFKPNTFKKKVKVSIINIVFQLNNNNVIVMPLPLFIYFISKLAAHNVKNFTNFVAMYLVYMAKSLKVPKFQEIIIVIVGVK